jgi:hypothetical protein
LPESLCMKIHIALLLFVTLITTFFHIESVQAMSRGKPVEEPPKPKPPVTPAPTPTPAPNPPPSNPAPPSNVDTSDATPLWEAQVKGSREWTNHLHSELDRLGQDLLDVIPADRSLFCPGYSKLSYQDRKKYWIYMMSAMVKFESGFNTNTSYKEDFNDSSGKAVVSRGLLQISIESARGYDCELTDAQQLHDPFKNLSCGVRILDRWVGRDGRIAGKVDSKWRGGARYWSVLREGDKTSYKSILTWSKKLKMCQ